MILSNHPIIRRYLLICHVLGGILTQSDGSLVRKRKVLGKGRFISGYTRLWLSIYDGFYAFSDMAFVWNQHIWKFVMNPLTLNAS